MKRIFLIFTLLLFSQISKVSAQQGDVSLVGLTTGYAQNGFGTAVNYNFYLKRGRYISGDFLLTFSKDKVSSLNIKVPYEGIYLNAGYFFQAFDISRELFTFNVGGGISVGYQILNNGSKELSSGALIASDSKFVAGTYLGLDTKMYLSYKFTGLLSIREYYHFNSDIGKLFPYIGIGVMYTLF